MSTLFTRRQVAACGAAFLAGATGLAGCGSDASGAASITNVSYDPTREFYEAYNELFAAWWLEQTGQEVQVTQSHGGSGAQATAVAEGLEADVVTLALEADVDAIAAAGIIEPGWVDEFENDSSPFTSVVVFLVRAGNPRGLNDWDDLASGGVGVICPNPKTSGGARWNYLAALAFAREAGLDEAAFMRALFSNVLVLDSGARGATNTFVENGQGDVLIAWENEALQAMDEHPGEFELVVPSVSIRCLPSVAVVDEVVERRGTREVATAYLEHLYAPEAQELGARYYYRPSDAEVLAQFGDVFDLSVKLAGIGDFGGWEAAQAEYFAAGGQFDEIYEG